LSQQARESNPLDLQEFLSRLKKVKRGDFRMSKHVARAVAAATLTAASPLAFVQEEGTLEEIVVTAERRETRLQDTPISIVALSAESMEQKGIEDLQEMSRFTPNLAIQGGRGTGDNVPSFVIRGVSGGGAVTSERGVALYIDGIYAARSAGHAVRTQQYRWRHPRLHGAACR
jgi:outer membrane receptor protein involved in Fe transport